MSFKERFNGKTTIVGKQGILSAINTLSNSNSPFDTSINHFNKPVVYQREKRPNIRIGAATTISAYSILNSHFPIKDVYNRREGTAGTNKSFVAEQKRIYSNYRRCPMGRMPDGRKILQEIALRGLKKESSEAMKDPKKYIKIETDYCDDRERSKSDMFSISANPPINLNKRRIGATAREINAMHKTVPMHNEVKPDSMPILNELESQYLLYRKKMGS